MRHAPSRIAGASVSGRSPAEHALVDVGHLLEQRRVAAQLVELLDAPQRRRRPEGDGLGALQVLCAEGVERLAPRHQHAHELALQQQRQRHPRALRRRPHQRERRAVRLGVGHRHRDVLLSRASHARVVRQQRAREHRRLGAAHRGDPQPGARLGHRQHREVGGHHALELLQHLLERLVGADRAVDRLERVAQLLGLDPSLALALDREGRVEAAPLARIASRSSVHHLVPLGLRPVGEPALDLAQ